MAGGRLPPPSSSDSALLFAGQRRVCIAPGPQLALLHAGLAGTEPGIFHEHATPATALAVNKLPAPVAQFVFHGTYLGRVGPAREIETMAVHESAGDRFWCCGNTRCFRNGRWHKRGNRRSTGVHATGCQQGSAKQHKTEEWDRGRGFHGDSLIPCTILVLFMDLFEGRIFTTGQESGVHIGWTCINAGSEHPIDIRNLFTIHYPDSW